jgi:predicted adenylyl cyclase CyaB
MRYEIELKAHAADPEAVQRALDGLVRSGRAGFVREFDKFDRYFLLPGAEPGQGRNFRLRMDGSGAILTWKQRSRRGALEVNLERECRVDDPEPLLELFLSLGARPYFTKRKIGREYALDGLCLEFCEVPPLGHFIELECLIDEPVTAAVPAGTAAGPGEMHALSPGPVSGSQDLIEDIRGREMAVLALLGIDAAAVEARPYSAMLAGLGDS